MATQIAQMTPREMADFSLQRKVRRISKAYSGNLAQFVKEVAERERNKREKNAAALQRIR